MTAITLYGASVSPYVRKVRAVLALKGLDYEQQQIVPVGDNQPAAFLENAPLRKIPLFQVGDDFLPDSSVICAYLERAHPQPRLLPPEPMAAAKALWFEEYADSHMVSVFGGHLFAELILAKKVFGREPIQADIDAALNHEIPEICDYLEGQLQGAYLVGDALSLGDVAVAGMFITLRHCDYTVDAARWPKLAAYSERLLSQAPFADLLADEQAFIGAFG